MKYNDKVSAVPGERSACTGRALGLYRASAQLVPGERSACTGQAFGLYRASARLNLAITFSLLIRLRREIGRWKALNIFHLSKWSNWDLARVGPKFGGTARLLST